MSLFSTLIVACTLSSLVLSGDYGVDKDNHLTTKKDYKTPRPTKWSPPSYEKEREWMKNWEKPTVDMIDEPTYEKEPAYLSWGQNPYNNRERRSQMMAQLEEQIESGKQELEALDALKIDVSEEQDEEGMKQAASTNGNAGFFQSDWSACFRTTSASVECLSSCCEPRTTTPQYPVGRWCVPKKKDWAGVVYFPRICRGSPFGSRGTC
jgi:hypothetical protein